jgi:hypothetical protein
MEKSLKIFNSLVLLGILGVLIGILYRLPQVKPYPTARDIPRDKELRRDFVLDLPLTYVWGVEGTVNARVDELSLSGIELEIGRVNSKLKSLDDSLFDIQTDVSLMLLRRDK